MKELQDHKLTDFPELKKFCESLEKARVEMGIFETHLKRHMAIVTWADLQEFKSELLADLEKLLIKYEVVK